MDRPSDDTPFRVIGHRGNPATHPENSLPGFASLARQGVDAAECDARPTADGVLVCSHDPSPARLGATSVPISEMTLGQVRAQRLAGGTGLPDVGIPTIDEVLTACSGTVELLVELKNNPLQPGYSAGRRQAAVLADLLDEREAAGAQDRLLAISSFDAQMLTALARHAPHRAGSTALLGRPAASGALLVREAAQREVRQLHLHVSSVLRDPRVARRAAAEGISVTTWTVNSRYVARRVRDAGVVGVITDRPGLLAPLQRTAMPIPA